MDKNIVLVGLMGAGKTRVGLALSRLLNRPFADSDREIESAAGLTIPDIFEKFGEEEFRRGERKVIQRLLRRKGLVLATGGGAFMQEEVRAAIKKSSISIWLNANLETLLERTAYVEHRPLLQDVDRKERLGVLMAERYPIYASADIAVDTDGRTPQDMAEIIQKKLEAFMADTGND